MAHYYTYTNHNSQRDELRYKVVQFSVHSALLKLKYLIFPRLPLLEK